MAKFDDDMDENQKDKVRDEAIKFIKKQRPIASVFFRFSHRGEDN